MIKTTVVPFTPQHKEKIKDVAAHVSEGKIVAFPTDTVYGLGTNFMNTDAVRRVYAIKGRSFQKPLVLMLARVEDLSQVAVGITEKAARLVEQFWPGPLTLVFNASMLVQMMTGQKTVAVRIPKHPQLLEFLKSCPKPFATTSANRSGQPSCLCAKDVRRIFAGKVDFILDGGVVRHKRESTVLDVSTYPFTVVREGVISQETLKKYL